MMSGDEFYDDETTSGFDRLAAADFRRDQLKDSSSCRGCGSPDPAIIREDRCSDCTCYLVAHVDSCPGEPYVKEGHVLREGWVAIEGPYGQTEVEVS